MIVLNVVVFTPASVICVLPSISSFKNCSGKVFCLLGFILNFTLTYCNKNCYFCHIVVTRFGRKGQLRDLYLSISHKSLGPWEKTLDLYVLVEIQLQTIGIIGLASYTSYVNLFLKGFDKVYKTYFQIPY